MNSKLLKEYYFSGEKIVEYLRNNQTSDGTIYDRIDSAITPDDHYAHTFYALALIKAYKRTKNEEWLISAKRVLDYYFDIQKSAKGHKEFNNLAILLICREIENIKSNIGYVPVSRLEREVDEMTFNVDINNTPSNNWLAIRACCHALRYYLLKGEDEKTEAEKLIERILGFQLKDGFFYDYPNIPHHNTYATPLTYHAKTCAMLSMYNKFIHNAPALEALTKGLSVLSKFIAPDGEAFYYGRTSNGIFGYISAIYAYEQTAELLQTDNIKQSGNFRESARLLFNHLTRWQQKDGHISICPNNEEDSRSGWDKYMHNTVYNAYTAALLLITGDISNA